MRSLRTVVLMVLLAAGQLFVRQVYGQEDPPFSLPPRQELLRIRSAVMHTNKGVIFLRLFPESAPWHVANLKYLADKGFYRGMPFHIYEPDLAIQTGAPTARVNSGPGYTLPAEFNNYKHEEGVLSMVRKPDDLDTEHTRRSHGSQFRIILRNARYMDGQYVVFGKVLKGLDVARKLRRGDIIKELHVFVSRPPTVPVATAGSKE